jgi:hypothetical protein
MCHTTCTHVLPQHSGSMCVRVKGQHEGCIGMLVVLAWCCFGDGGSLTVSRESAASGWLPGPAWVAGLISLVLHSAAYRQLMNTFA